MYLTEKLKIKYGKATDLDFVNVPDKDVPLYIDPERIEYSKGKKRQNVSAKINDFFYTVCDVAQNQPEENLIQLFEKHCHEIKTTHLGLSRSGFSGHGASAHIIVPIIKRMKRMKLFDFSFVKRIEDISILTPRFGEDCLSDLITNIVQEDLIQYTIEQLNSWHARYDLYKKEIDVWDIRSHSWIVKLIDYPCVQGNDIILVPKEWVGKTLLSTPNRLLNMYALTYRQSYHLNKKTGLCRVSIINGHTEYKEPYKKAIMKAEVKGKSVKAYNLEVLGQENSLLGKMHADNKRAYSTKVFRDKNNKEIDEVLFEYKD